MTVTLSGLLWALAIVALLVFVAYWWGRRSASPAAPVRDAAPPAEPRPRIPTAVPPPANAGGAHHPGQAAPPVAPRRDAQERASAADREDPMVAKGPTRTPGAVPPPWVTGSKAPAQSTAERTGPKRSAPPPAASAGGGVGRVASAGPRPTLSRVKSWGYQLQNLDIANAAKSPFDLLVIDYSKDGSDEEALKPAELARLQKKPDGSRRLVIAYLSIGEAESYRYYWDDRWKKAKPGWMLGENPEWKENYAVCFWEPEWQKLFCGSPDAYVDKILAAGFDGIYLDKCDVYEDMRRHYKKAAGSRPDLERDMVAFVERLSLYAKSKDPSFAVIMQNAEALLDDARLMKAIDGVAKEELVYGVDSPEKLNTREDFEWSHDQLAKAKAAGKLVLVVEYLNAKDKIRQADQLVEQAGFVLHVSPKNRELDTLVYRTFEA
jgi:cysteinyl-tRNA synthetase